MTNTRYKFACSGGIMPRLGGYRDHARFGPLLAQGVGKTIYALQSRTLTSRDREPYRYAHNAPSRARVPRAARVRGARLSAGTG